MPSATVFHPGTEHYAICGMRVHTMRHSGSEPGYSQSSGAGLALVRLRAYGSNLLLVAPLRGRNFSNG
jgi:hypothetical protein